MERVLRVYMGEEGEENLRKLDDCLETVRIQKIEIEENDKLIKELMLKLNMKK